MKLNIPFTSLENSINLMGAERRGQFQIDFIEKTIDKIDMELAQGKDVDITQVDVENGLLNYEGRQILLYIKDHGSQFESALSNPQKHGRKYHVADCSTLKSMRESGRFERYVATNDTSGRFLISGLYGEDYAELAVCQNCLKALNYKGWNSGERHWDILNRFNMAEFFQTYSSFFPHMPKRKAQDFVEGYSKDWAKISSHYRVEKAFTCEECGVNLKSNRNLLHVHHVNGVKSDNSEQNLKALCIDCHSQQNFHEHMYVSHEERQTIIKLRNEQSLIGNTWNDVMKMADPGMHGVLYTCRTEGYHLPEVCYYLEDEIGGLGAKLELAWPKIRFGIAIDRNDIEEGVKLGWQVITTREFLENYRRQGSALRY